MATIDRRGLVVDGAAPSSSAMPDVALAIKLAVRAATTANISLAGEQTIDGVAVVEGDRVLVKDQTAGADNGIYVASTGNWSRSVDFDASAEIASGVVVMASAGTVSAHLMYQLTTAAPIVLGTSNLTFVVTGTVIPAALTTTGDTNISLTLGGTPLAALLKAVSITVVWNSFLSMMRGGSGKPLTASNGGLVYTDADSMEVLAGTATARQIPLSGANTAPSWSTATFPSTAGAGTVMAALTANTFTATSTPTLGASGTLGSWTFGNATSGLLTVQPVAGALGTTTTLIPINETLVGRATTDTLTNKTINASNNTVSNLATSMFAANVVDTDGTLAANSDTRLATQKATKTYVDALIAANDAMVFKGVIDCSANPNYPAADRGWVYRVSVAGKIGGASGPNVEAGDTLLCITDGTAAGTQAAVGANWGIIQVNIDGAVTLTGSQTLTNKTLTSPAITTPTGIVKGDVGLGSVDNTSDATKNAATATFTNKTFNTAGTGNVFSINGTAVSTAVPATVGGTGLTGGTSGGLLFWSSGTTLASSGLLTQYGMVYGGGAGGAPASTAAGTNGQVVTANTSAPPTFQDNLTFGSLGAAAVLGPASTLFLPITGAGANAAETVGITVQRAPYKMIVKNLYVAASGAAGAAQSYIFTFRTGATLAALADSAVTATISGAAAIDASDTSNSVTLNAGDYFSVKVVTSAAAVSSTMTANWSMMKTP